MYRSLGGAKVVNKGTLVLPLLHSLGTYLGTVANLSDLIKMHIT